jgi:uncharacterized protein DUF1345
MQQKTDGRVVRLLTTHYAAEDPTIEQWFLVAIGDDAKTKEVSDVTVKSKVLRRTVTAHGLLSFIFNVTLLALAINLAASALGSLGSQVRLVSGLMNQSEPTNMMVPVRRSASPTGRVSTSICLPK